MLIIQLFGGIDSAHVKYMSHTFVAYILHILGCSKSFESDIYRAVEEPKFLRHFKISYFI